MTVEVKLPPLGDDAPDQAEVSFWYVEVGEAIEGGQDMVEMLTDKAAFTVPAPAGGKVQQILAPEGATVKVGQVMAVMDQ